MNDSWKPSKVRLLWEGYSSVPKGEPFILDGDIPRRAGYEVDFGPNYGHYLAIDVNLLKNRDRAIELADARGQVGYTPYRITERGIELLRAANYPA